MLAIDKWAGNTKGISIKIGFYSFSVHPSILSHYRTRKYFKPDYLQQLFSIRKNLRLSICEWTLDITLLGITFQFCKYKYKF